MIKCVSLVCVCQFLKKKNKHSPPIGLCVRTMSIMIKTRFNKMFLEVMRNLKQASCFTISTRCRTKSQIFRFPHIKLLNKILHLALVKIAEFSGNSRKTCWSPRNKIILEFLSASPSVTTKYHIQLLLPTNWVRDWIFGSRIFGEVCFFLTQRKKILLV